MKKSWIWSLLCIGGLFFLSGCTTHERLVPSVGIGNLRFEPLGDSEYKILDTVKGTAKGGRILFWTYGDTSSIFDNKAGSFYPPTSSGRKRISPLRVILFGVFGFLFPVDEAGLYKDSNVAAAMYNAIESSPSADSLILPKVNKTTFQAFLWSNYEVEVEGKGIEITKDAQ